MIYDVQSYLQQVVNIGKFAFSVGDTIPTVYNRYRARQIELVTLNTVSSVAWVPCRPGLFAPVHVN
jgi:hypothetical protein